MSKVGDGDGAVEGGHHQPLVAYVARQDGSSVRIGKEVASLTARGFEVVLIGWDRSGGAQPSEECLSGVRRELYKKRVGYGPLAVAQGIVGFVVHVYRLLRQLDPDIIHCANEDLTVLGLLFGRRKSLVVCDLFDSIALKWSSSPWLIRKITGSFASVAQRRSDVVIATDEHRANLVHKSAKHVAIVPNYPPKSYANTELHGPPVGSFRLFVSGALSANRGTEILLMLLQRRKDLRIVIAGWIQDESARQLTEHERATYFGKLSPWEAAQLCMSCHALSLLYAPSNLNNVYASPNKLYDAILADRPVIANDELVIAEWIRQNGVGVTVPFGDLPALEGAIAEIDQMWSAKDGPLFDREWALGFSWDAAESALLEAYTSMFSTKV